MSWISPNDIREFLDFLDHKVYWVHVFKPAIGETEQKGDLHSEFTTKKQRVIEICERFNGKGLCCVAINQREPNKTKTEDIEQVNCIFVDIDVPKSRRQNHVSAKEDHEHAISTAYEIKNYLEQEWGLNTGLIVDSGNGAQLFLKVDIPIKTIEEKDTVKDRLSMIEKDLKDKFNSERVSIDHVTKDFNRRVKIPGTENKKNTQQAENRLSKILWRAK